jgi:two-component system, NtrC family, sensor kinase
VPQAGRPAAAPEAAAPVAGPLKAPALAPARIARTAADDAQPLALRNSLRGKAALATLLLFGYLVGSALYLDSERGKILEAVAALELLARHERAVALTEASVNRTLAEFDAGNPPRAAPDPARPTQMALALASSVQGFETLDQFDPGYARLQRALVRSSQALAGVPQRDDWIALRETLVRTADELEIRRASLTEQREAMTLAYQRQYDAVTLDLLVLAGAGLVLFGAGATWFFTRLALDISRLEAHARRIVRGTRGVVLEVRRGDELGRLMRAVNRMANELDEREKQIELDNERRAYHDKMASVGALAAGIAHEVNNPLAAIAGAAQELRASAEPLTPRQLDAPTALILAQAERAARAARQLAQAAAPEAGEPDWIDLNALLRCVIQLIGYDRRYRQLRFETSLDPQLPALRSAGDALRQVLMQIVSLACDALVAAGQEGAWLRLETGAAGARVTLQLSLPPVLDVNRPELQRSLAICRAMIEPQGGRLALGQDGSTLLRFQLSLPAGACETE